MEGKGGNSPASPLSQHGRDQLCLAIIAVAESVTQVAYVLSVDLNEADIVDPVPAPSGLIYARFSASNQFATRLLRLVRPARCRTPTRHHDNIVTVLELSPLVVGLDT